MRFWTGLIVPAVLLAAGCQGTKSAPATCTAGGKVIYVDGTPLTGGAVQFRPQSAGALAAVGEVGKDGKFTLSTIVDGNKIGGAVVGTYQATYIPPIGADQKGGQPVTLRDVYSVQAHDGNDFTLTIPRPGQ